MENRRLRTGHLPELAGCSAAGGSVVGFQLEVVGCPFRTVSALLNYMATTTTAFLTPFFLIQGNQMTPAHAGSLLMAMPLVMAAVAPMSGWLSDRIGSRIPTVAGMACLAAGMFLLGRLGAGGSDRQIVLRLGLVGLGIGLFTSPNNSAIMGAVPQTHQGLGSGIVATARTMGNVLGVAVSGSLFGMEVQKLAAALGQETLAVTGAYRHAVTTGAGIALAGALTSLIRGRSSISSAVFCRPTSVGWPHGSA